MPLDQLVPPIQVGTISSVLHEMEGPAKTPDWKNKILERIERHDQIMGAYLRQIEEQWGSESVIIALIVYRIIESQLEADQMDRDFGG